MPPGFSFPEPETALWRPLPLDRERTQLGNFSHQGVARLADGVTAAQGQAELETLVSDLPEVFPDQFAAPYLAERGFGPLIVPLLETVVGDIRATLWLLLSAVGILLLVACVNVANLFLVRSEARTDEWAIRLALGAHRRGLAVALLLESVLLGLAGGAAALPIAWLAVRTLVRNAPRDLPRLDEVSVDGSVLLFGLAVSIVGGLLCGLLPAWRASAVGTTANLTAGARGATDGRNRQLARRGLVVAQISLAVTLLVGSGLAMRSFQRLAAVDPGFDPADALTFGVTLPGRVYMTSASRLVFHRQMLERLSGLPGVSGAAAATAMPLTSYAALSNHDIEGWDGADGVQPVLPWKQVSPGYFETMGTTLLEGREFDRLDAGRAPVAIVSRSLARTYWPGEPALGKGLRPGGLPAPAGDEWVRVVGVVEDVHETTLHDDPPAMGYYPMAVAGADGEMAFVRPSMRYVVRGPNATALTAGVREIVRDLDPPSSHRGRFHSGGVGRPGARAAGVRHDPADRCRRVLLAAGRGRPLRRDRLHGHPAAARDRHPHGGRGGGRRHPPAGAGRGRGAGSGRRRARLRRRNGGDPTAAGAAVRDQPPRTSRLRHSGGGAGRYLSARELAARAPRDQHRSDGSAASRVKGGPRRQRRPRPFPRRAAASSRGQTPSLPFSPTWHGLPDQRNTAYPTHGRCALRGTRCPAGQSWSPPPAAR